VSNCCSISASFVIAPFTTDSTQSRRAPAAVAGLADGVVVGSRAVQVAEEGPAALRDYVRSLRDAIDSI
jgi:tryptophan synthase alpha subunit